METLAALIGAQKEEKLWRAYTANVLWSIARTLYREYPWESYTAMTDEHPEDTRTGREIIGDLIDMLSEGGEE